MEKLFKLKERGTNVRTEIFAGLTTFLSMVYILAVNPEIMAAAGMSPGAVFTGTAIASAIATLCMAFFANYPIALSCGMGLNAYFAYSVCIPLAEQGYAEPWKIALTAVLFEGIIFIILSFFKFREKLVNDIPKNLKYGITVGIGLFIALIGLKGAGIVVANPSTLVDLGDLSSPQVVLAFAGIIITAVLHHFKVPGSILFGILATWVLGMIAQATGWYVVDIEAGAYSLFPTFGAGQILPEAPYLFQFDFEYMIKNVANFAIIVFSFLFVDIYNTVGTLIGVAEKGNLLDKDGKLEKAGGALMADAVGTTVGACLGAPTVTSYVESSAGVAEGGRTGLASVVTSVLFILALFLSPIFLAIPSFATTPALVFVGISMISVVKEMTFEGDVADVVSGFLALAVMPFCYSIAYGIMFGILSWVVLKVLTGKIRDVNPIMWISTALFALYIVTLVM